MSSTFALQTRLKELSAALGEIYPLVDRLRNFTTAIGQGDEARLELGAEVHARLKEAEDEMELLRVEVDALDNTADTRRKGPNNGEKEAERERVVTLAWRLTEDLKRTRGDFRSAQLQAKRNAELAKRKEREILLSRSQNAETRAQTSEKLTQDDLVLNASSDVTLALRRTHQLMQAELSRSQFAQETLEQSTAALSSLSESYTSLDTLISSSRNLLSSLLRSQKSDTWYLETAFYILIGTIAWLLFRRILYGPLWWLVWLPIKLITRFTIALLGAVGISSKAVQSAASATFDSNPVLGTSTLHRETETPIVGATATTTAWDQPDVSGKESEGDGDRIIDRIGEMAEEGNKHEGTNVDDISPEERRRQEEMPRNPKKRMYEADVDGNKKDEL